MQYFIKYNTEMRAEGKLTPSVVFWSRNDSNSKIIEYDWVLQKTYDMYYA